MHTENQGFIKFGKTVFLLSIAVLALGVGVGIVQATLITSPSVIAGPADVTASGYTNDAPQIFNEQQHTEVSNVFPNDGIEGVNCDNGDLPDALLETGTKVNSHLVLFHTPETGPSTKSASWTFAEDILCVIADNTLYQSATDATFGLSGTSYGGNFTGRGTESDDTVTFSGNELTVTLTADSAGDRIRVLTAWNGPTTDTTPPDVSCEMVSVEKEDRGNQKSKDGKNEDPLVQVYGIDDRDGVVDVVLTDTITETTFGPYPSGTTIKHTIAAGAPARASESQNANQGDYTIRSQGELTISAADAAGNVGEAVCSS